ncbi:hypothetical protein CMV_026093, partial [Castanea mollissima]
IELLFWRISTSFMVPKGHRTPFFAKLVGIVAVEVIECYAIMVGGELQ